MAFLPVAVPGGQGKRPVYIDPEEVIAIFSNNEEHTSTSIVFRQHGYIMQVRASDQEVFRALQCGQRIQVDCCKR